MIIALHFIFNLENILSQQSSIVGDMSLWILQSLESIIFSELPGRSPVNPKHKTEAEKKVLQC